MLKREITYEDFDGNQRTEDFYFNLTKAELVRLELSETGSFSEMIKKIIASKDNREIIEQFQKIILMAYGIREEGGRRFIKNQQVREEFEQTNAFSELFIELATNEESAAAFMRGIVPSDLGVVNDAPTATPKHAVSAEPEKPLDSLSREELINKLSNFGK